MSRFISVNFSRLMALENIEMIMAELNAAKGLGGRQLAKKVSTQEKDKREKAMVTIHKYLSHHYVLRRSVVFVVDTEFESVIYHDKANRYVKKLFK